jgi:hypothetical protein
MVMTTALSQNRFVHSFLFLRRSIGIIGMALPVTLTTAVAARSGELLGSISGYYYSDLRDVFVGALCAIGVFLIFYRGLDRVEDVLSIVAGVTAIMVALFPTRPAGQPTQADKVTGYIHLACAAIFFLTLAIFCIFLFTRSETDPPLDLHRKVIRNRIYVVCGVTIVLCLALSVVSGSILEDQARSLHPIVWLESTAIFAFGVSWLIKGQTFLRNRPTYQLNDLN